MFITQNESSVEDIKFKMWKQPLFQIIHKQSNIEIVDAFDIIPNKWVYHQFWFPV